MKRLYLLSGSSASTDANSMLSSTGISFEVVHISSREALAGIYRDLAIGTLPALIMETTVIQGVGQIRSFVESQRA